jgi:hypothetical protein
MIVVAVAGLRDKQMKVVEMALIIHMFSQTVSRLGTAPES